MMTLSNGDRRNSALGCYTVLDLTDEKAMLCGKLLADLGAVVIKIEKPGGDPARRIGPFWHGIQDPEKSLSWFAFNTGKNSITLDIEAEEGQAVFKRLVRMADMVVESFSPGYLDTLGLGYGALSTINPRIIMISITPFGQTGPYSQYKSSDLVCQALGGILYLCGDPDRPPTRLGGSQAYVQAGAQAGMGAMLALFHREVTGQGQHVDVSVQECLPIAPAFAVSFWDLNKTLVKRTGHLISRGDRVSPLGFKCKDGYVSAQITAEWFQRIVEWMDSVGMAADLKDPSWWEAICNDAIVCLTKEQLDHICNVVAPFIARYTKAELYKEAQARHIGWMPQNTPKDLLEDEQLKARNAFVEVKHDELNGESIMYPDSPLRLSRTPGKIYGRAPLIGEHNREIDHLVGEGDFLRRVRGSLRKKRPLEGIRVVDFSWNAAGPFLTTYLGQYGAEVIKIESFQRPDNSRRTPPFKHGVNDPDYSASFPIYNDSKYSMSLDLKDPRAIDIAKELIARADVVVENWTSSTIDRLGLGYADLQSVNPDIIMISMSLQGQTGPARLYSGYGFALQGLAGLTHLTGWPDRWPVGMGAYTDYLVPFLGGIAVIAALDYRRRTGKGQYIDFSQLEGSLQCVAVAILDYTSNGCEGRRMGNRDPYAAPHGVFRCQGEDRWCAIAVSTDEEWEKLCEIMGNPQWSRDPKFTSLADRKENEEELERRLEQWTIGHTAEDLMSLLCAAKISAGVVSNAEDLTNDPQLKHRNHFKLLEHPALGEQRCNSTSFKLSRSPGEPSMRAPLLGEHTEYVCRKILGMSKKRFSELSKTGVLSSPEG